MQIIQLLYNNNNNNNNNSAASEAFNGIKPRENVALDFYK